MTDVVVVEVSGPEQVIVEVGVPGVSGLSAYQIAVAHGFVGDEVQWLASLVGGTAGAVFITRAAGEDLGGHRAVILLSGSAFYADSTELSHAGLVVGLTTGAVALGGAASIQSCGELLGLSGLIPDQPIYLSTNGTLIQTPPSSGFALQLGIALSSTAILININTAIGL